MKKLGKGCLTVFIVLIGLGFIGSLFGGDDKEKEASKNVTQNVEESSKTKDVATEKVKDDTNKDIIKSGQYQVGKDLPAGEYKVFSENGYSYIECTKDSTGSVESIIYNDNFKGFTYAFVQDGNYLKLQGCYAIPVAKAKKFEGDSIKDGMYKVGVDIPAGEYNVISNGSSSYIEVTNKPHMMDSIVSNDNFNDNRLISVSDGQYLKIVNATAEKQ